MKRQALNNGSWFNIATAEVFAEETRWDGQNRISCATGSQWEHEEIYRTKSGRWVLHHWSQWQGSTPSWTEISNEEAARWLVINDHEPHEACSEEYAALEV